MSDSAANTTARVLLLVDESGSMASHAAGTVEQLNSYLDSLGRLPGATLVTAATFEGHRGYRERFRDMPAQGTPRFCAVTQPQYATPFALAVAEKDGILPYAPGGGTPLFDAIGKLVYSVPDLKPALVAILTDGEENESREWTKVGIAELIANREAKGWTFAFLMAGFDKMAAERYTQSFGGRVGNTMSYQKGMEAFASNNLALATQSWRSGAAVSGQSVGELYASAGVAKDLNEKPTTVKGRT